MSDLDFNFKYDRTLKDILKAVPKKFVDVNTELKFPKTPNEK